MRSGLWRNGRRCPPQGCASPPRSVNQVHLESLDDGLLTTQWMLLAILLFVRLVRDSRSAYDAQFCGVERCYWSFALLCSRLLRDFRLVICAVCGEAIGCLALPRERHHQFRVFLPSSRGSVCLPKAFSSGYINVARKAYKRERYVSIKELLSSKTLDFSQELFSVLYDQTLWQPVARTNQQPKPQRIGLGTLDLT